MLLGLGSGAFPTAAEAAATVATSSAANQAMAAPPPAVFTAGGAATLLGLAFNMAITLNVNRHRHPIIWWGLGPLPLAYKAYTFLTSKEL